jgi:hypothetical protein
MPISTRIRDRLTGRVADVTQDHALKVALSGGLQGSSVGKTPEELTAIKYYSGYLHNGSSIDLNVDGSVTPVEFVEESTTLCVKWITRVRILLNGTYFELNTNDFRRFGAATAGGSPLTNGIQFWVEQGGVTTQIFTSPVRYTGDFMNYAEDYTNIINAISAQSDFLSFDMQFVQPIVLPPTVTDKLVMKIRDNLTAISLFQVALDGYQEFV